MVDDPELLRRYAMEGSEPAFTEFVQRHLGLVYGAALRRVGGDAALAAEISQSVFVQCARKARMLQAHPALAGWLHRCTRFAAIDAVRARQRHERLKRAETMHLESETPDEPATSWEELRPVIDALLDRLGDGERAAVLLRFFAGASFAEVGRQLRISEDAARLRVTRALEKLRTALAGRGIRSSVVALELAMVSRAAEKVPATLASAVSAQALAAVGGTGGSVAGTLLYLLSNIQIGVLGVFLAAGATALLVEARADRALQQEVAGLRRVVAQLPTAAAPPAPMPANPIDTLDAELAPLQARIRELQARPDGVVDAEMLPRSAWGNVGYATPEAAFQTFLWAATTSNYDALARSYVFGDRTKAQADAFFATLNPEQKQAYGSPERLIAPYLAARPAGQPVEAMQVIEIEPASAPGEVTVHYWMRMADGTEHGDSLPFEQTADGWRMGGHDVGMSIPAAVRWMQANLDPTIGAGATAAQ